MLLVELITLSDIYLLCYVTTENMGKAISNLNYFIIIIIIISFVFNLLTSWFSMYKVCILYFET